MGTGLTVAVTGPTGTFGFGLMPLLEADAAEIERRLAPPVAEWAEAVGRPAIMGPRKARRELGWKPRFSAVEALRDTLRAGA
jgi:nucleoside-diphosphate-sugar epimerase